jgi:hypothetical protein
MFRLLSSAVLVLLATAPLAARPSTLGMTCAEAQALVARQGAIVMSTGQHTYDRFVAHPGFCMTAEWARPATAPTSDSPACPLGYTCTSNPPFWYDDDHWLFDR